MAEQLQQALVLYRKSHDHRHVLSDQDQKALEHSIARLTQDSLKQQTGMASFTHPAAFAEVIRRTVETGKFQGERAASAFSTLESYVLLLLGQPWKREFRTLKLYGGFFCTRVKAHLENPERILSIVGYSLDKSEFAGNYCLVLASPPDRELLLTVAFDCLVASAECRHIGERYDKMKCLNFSLFDIMNFLLFEDPSHPISSSSALLSPAAPPPLATPCVNAMPSPMHSAAVLGRGSAFDASRTASVFSTPQTVTAAGGMGFGVVSTASRTLPPPTSGQVFVSAPRHVHTLPHPFRPVPSADAGRELALRTDLVTRTVSDVSGPPSRVPSIASSAMPSRMPGSAAYPSSPYGTTSSGYVTTSSVGSASGFVADMATAAIPPTTFPVPRAARQFLPLPPKHSPLSPAFPYADEDPVDSATASYPEGTQEEHMLESLRNMDVSGGGVSGAVEQVVGAKRSVPQVAPVSYDDWNWFHRAQSSGPPPYDTVTGTRPYGDSRLAQHVGVERTRSGLQNPATAVKELVSQPSAPMTNGQIQQFRTHIGHRSGSADYLPALNHPTLLRNAVSPVPGPLSESALSRTHERGFATCDITVGPAVGANIAAANSSSTATSAGTFFTPSAANSNSTLGYHTVAYPLSSDPGYFQKQPATTVGMTGPPGTQHKQQVSTFTDMVDTTRSSGSHLLSRQASSNGFVLSNNGADTLHTVKHFSPSIGASAESCTGIVMREKVGSMTSRISSLSNPDRPHNSPAPICLDRQASHSMDLGALKWRCRRCTMENSAHDTVCVACFKSRDGPDVQYPEAGESKLVCPMCTLENNPGCANCDACNTPLPQGVHTYV